jgi:hypothetical protein
MNTLRDQIEVYATNHMDSVATPTKYLRLLLQAIDDSRLNFTLSKQPQPKSLTLLYERLDKLQTGH